LVGDEPLDSGFDAAEIRLVPVGLFSQFGCQPGTVRRGLM
jgi:hypothetical protein